MYIYVNVANDESYTKIGEASSVIVVSVFVYQFRSLTYVHSINRHIRSRFVKMFNSLQG